MAQIREVRTLEKFVIKARNRHNNFYQYDEFNYIDSHTKGKILCPLHGFFWQNPNNHLNGKGCVKCSYIKLHNDRVDSKESFILKARKIHGAKYSYDGIILANHHTKIKIICPIHGQFWQTPNGHLAGKGCSKCKKIVLKNGFICDSKIEAYFLLKFLEKGENFEYNKRYPKCDRNFKFDFYFPEEDKYLEITSFDDNIDRKSPYIRQKYMARIEWKRNFVENTLKSKFEFLYLTPSRDMLQYVAENMI